MPEVQPATEKEITCHALTMELSHDHRANDIRLA